MEWFKNLVSEGAAKVVDSVSSGLDSLFTSDEERLKARAVIEKQVQDHTINILNGMNRFESEVTQRWKSDNESLITKLVRPVSYGWVLFLFTLIVLFDGNLGGGCVTVDGVETCTESFTVNAAYIPVIEGLLVVMTIAYFGSRGAEKISKILGGKGKSQTERWG